MAVYGEDLAYIHDRGFSGFALDSAPGLLSLLRRSKIPAGKVVDLACGTGIWARQLGFAGYDVLGIDASPEMLVLARQNAPDAQFQVGSLVDAAIPRCDAVTAIGEGISYAFCAGGDLSRWFERIHRALGCGGVLIFDYAQSGRTAGGMPRKAYWTGHDWAVLVDAHEDGSVLHRKITSFRQVGASYRRSEETHRLRLYKAEEVRLSLVAAGFIPRALKGFGRYRFHSGQSGYIAVKTANSQRQKSQNTAS